MALASGLPTGCTGAAGAALALERRGAGRWVGGAMEVVEEGAEWPAVTRPERLERVDAMGVQQVGET
jgi:hypothetical protein